MFARLRWCRRSCRCGCLLCGGADCCFHMLLIWVFDGLLKTELLEHVLGCKQLGEGLVGDDVKLINLPDSGVLPEW